MTSVCINQVVALSPSNQVAKSQLCIMLLRESIYVLSTCFLSKNSNVKYQKSISANLELTTFWIKFLLRDYKGCRQRTLASIQRAFVWKLSHISKQVCIDLVLFSCGILEGIPSLLCIQVNWIEYLTVKRPTGRRGDSRWSVSSTAVSLQNEARLQK